VAAYLLASYSLVSKFQGSSSARYRSSK